MLTDQVINLVGVAYAQEAYPHEALPVITFEDAAQFHINGEQVDLMHFGEAHNGRYRGHLRSNAVHLGDVYNNAGYPFIDVNGGTLDGVIEFCKQTAQIDDDGRFLATVPFRITKD